MTSLNIDIVKYSIYKATNKVNGKIYIGKTKNFQKRIKKHKSSSFNKKDKAYYDYFHKAIRKYGWENFQWTEFASCLNKEDINNIEKETILFFKSHDNNIGYNLTLGGEGGDTFSFLNEEDKNKFRLKISKITKGRSSWSKGLTKENNDTLKNMSEKKKGRKIKFTEQHCKNLSKSLSGKKRQPWTAERKNSQSLNNKNRKEVICNETKQIFQSMAKAAKEMKLSPSHLNEHLHGKHKYVKGYTFSYIPYPGTFS